MNLIVGAGAVGTTLAAFLTKARQTVRLVVLEEQLPNLQAAQHLQVERVGGAPPISVTKPSLSTHISFEGVENVFLCVKYPQLQSVLDSMPKVLPEGVRLISCLNGVGVPRLLRQQYPATEVVAMTIQFNAQLLEPLHAQLTTRPIAQLTTDNPQLLHQFDQSPLHIVRVEDESATWGRLLLSLNNALCALTYKTFKDVLCDPVLRGVSLQIMDEAVMVLDKAGIRYQFPMQVNYGIYRWLLAHGGQMPWWLAQRRFEWSEQSYPSMVADMLHGQKTEIEQLNGEIVQLASQLGVQAPSNKRLCELVAEHEGQPLKQGLAPDVLQQALAV